MTYNVKRGKLASRKAKFKRDNPDGEIIVSGRPIAIISEHPTNDDERIFRLYEGEGVSDSNLPGFFANVIVNLVRHAAMACQVSESAMWKAVDAERRNPTGKVAQLPADYTELQDTPTEGGTQ